MALAAADVALFPEAGGSPDDPMQRRPVALLPVPYRLWARLRLPAVEGWRASWDPAVGDTPKGADGQAWDLAWDWPAPPPAVDMTKRYDSIRLPFLRRVLSAAGWPAGVLEPLLAAAASHRRRGWAGGGGAAHVAVFSGLAAIAAFQAAQHLLG